MSALTVQGSQGPSWLLAAHSAGIRGDDRVLWARDRNTHFKVASLNAGLEDVVCKEVEGENGRWNSWGEWRVIVRL